MQAGALWSEVRKRRNQFFLGALSWLLIGPALMQLYSVVLPTFLLPAFGAIFSWMGLMWWLRKRVTDLRCFHCDQQAFSHAFFFMRHAKCEHCGAAFADP